MLFRLLVVFFISFSFAYALSDYQLEQRAKKHIKHSSKTEQFLAYNDYKTLYLHAILKEDKKLRYRSLQGIVKSAKKLHIDVSQYKKELSLYIPIKTNKHKKRISKLTIKPTKQSIKKKQVSKQTYNKLQKIYFKDGRLILDFSKKLGKKDVNFFKSFNKKHRRYKYIFDIRASMFFSSTKLKKNGIRRIEVAPHTKKIVRLVIENSSKIKLRFKLDGDKLSVLVPSNTLKKKLAKKKIAKTQVAKKKEAVSTFSKQTKKKIVVIDAGHGGKDPGAVGYKKYREKVIVFSIAKRLSKILRSRGYKVYMTRSSDKFIKLSNRTKFANRKNADIFVSIHANAVGQKYKNDVSGIETYFLSPSRSKRAERVAEKENSADLSDMKKYGKHSLLNFLNNHKMLASNKLAIDLQRSILGMLNKSYKNVKDAGVREGPFWVLIGAKMPSVLIEVGFISNPKEARRLVNSKYQQRLALGMANGIERYFIKNR